MALDPNIILQAGNFKTPDYAQTMELRSQLQLRNAAIAKSQREEAMAQQKMVRLGQIGTQASTGDYAGAKNTALAAGDFDVLEHIKGLEGDQRDLVKRRAEAAAPVLYTAGKLPYEQRKAFIEQAAPNLAANGWKPEEIASFDPTDGAISSMVSQAQSITDILGHEEKAADRAQRAEDNAATRQFSRDNAFISAGILPSGAGVPGAGAPAAPVEGKTQYGWTPRARHGGDNTDEAVDGKIAGMSAHLGVDPTTPLTGMSDAQIAQALTLSEGGKGSLADRNNNPANLTDPKTGAFRKFPTKAAGLQAAAAQVARNRARGANTIQTLVEGLPVGGAGGGLPGGLTAIPGGKLDKPRAAKMSPDEVEAEGLDPKLTYYRNAEGIPQAVSGQNNKSSLKPPPAVAMKAYIGNRASIGKIDGALAAVAAKPDAVGFTKGLTPDWISARTDPTGVDARSKIADIGSLLIHDRSGAAVTVAETPRLKPFVPEVGDTPAQVKTKLTNLRAALAQENTDTEDVYSEEQGFKFPTFRARTPGTLTAKPAAKPAVNAGPKVGTVEDGYRFKGGDPKSQSSWEKVAK